MAAQGAAYRRNDLCRQGDLEYAARWAEGHRLDVDAELTPIHDLDYAVLARILVAQGRLEAANRLLARLLEAAEAGERLLESFELLILQALIFQAGEHMNQAMTALERALTLAESGGFWWPAILLPSRTAHHAESAINPLNNTFGG